MNRSPCKDCGGPSELVSITPGQVGRQLMWRCRRCSATWTTGDAPYVTPNAPTEGRTPIEKDMTHLNAILWQAHALASAVARKSREAQGWEAPFLKDVEDNIAGARTLSLEVASKLASNVKPADPPSI